jgi:hypothetical protein
MVLKNREDLLLKLMELLSTAAECDDATQRNRLLVAGMRRLAKQAYYYPLRHLADQWQMLLDNHTEETC